MYVNLFSGVALMTKKYCHKNKPIWNIYIQCLQYLQWFPWLPIMQFRRIGVFRDFNEQFGTHEKLSLTSTIDLI